MATQAQPVVRLPAGAPTPEQIDSLGTRIAQAAGIRAGTSQAAVGAVTSALTAAEGPALQASDAIQTIMEDAMTLAAQTAMASTGAAIAAIENLLQPLTSDMVAYLKANAPKRRCRGGSGSGAGVAAAPPAAPPPTATVGAPIVQVAPSPPPPPSGTPISTAPTGTTIWTIWVNCTSNQYMAVPNLSATDRNTLEGQGWKPVTPPTAITASSTTNVATYLQQTVAGVRSMCQLAGMVPNVAPIG